MTSDIKYSPKLENTICRTFKTVYILLCTSSNGIIRLVKVTGHEMDSRKGEKASVGDLWRPEK